MTCKGFPSVVGGHLKSISFQFSLLTLEFILHFWAGSYISKKGRAVVLKCLGTRAMAQMMSTQNKGRASYTLLHHKNLP